MDMTHSNFASRSCTRCYRCTMLDSYQKKEEKNGSGADELISSLERLVQLLGPLPIGWVRVLS